MEIQTPVLVPILIYDVILGIDTLTKINAASEQEKHNFCFTFFFCVCETLIVKQVHNLCV